MLRAALKKIGMTLVAMGAAEAAPTSRTPASPQQFARQAAPLRRDGAGGKPVLLAGTIQMLGLSAIKRELGPKWAAVSDKAYGVAEAIIQGHLAPEDLCERHDDESYVLCFAKLDRAGANRKTALIVQEIKETLLQQLPEADELEFSHFVAEVDYETVSQSGDSMLASLMSSLQEIKKEAESSFQDRRRKLLMQAQLVYSPVMFVRETTAFMNRCLLGDATGKMALEHLEIVSNPEEFAAALADLDLLVLQRAVKALHDLIQGNQNSIVLLPVHYQTLNQRKFRESYLQLCAVTPEPYRNFMALEIRSVPEGVPTGRILDIVPQLKPFFRYVLLNVHAHENRLNGVKASGLFGVSVELAEMSDNPAALNQKLSKFVAAARAASLHVAAHDANTLGLAKAAIAAGVDFVDGEAVAPKSATPKGVHKLKVVAA